MAASSSQEGVTTIREMHRTLSHGDAVKCVLQADSLELVLTLALLPPRTLREAAVDGVSDPAPCLQ